MLSGILLLSINSMDAQDNPNNALPLTVGMLFQDYPLVGSNVNATSSEINDTSIPHPSCASYQGSDVWYSIVVPDGGFVIVETRLEEDGISDTGLNIYEGGIGNLLEIDCSDDDGTAGFSFLAVSGRAPGEILYIRVWEYFNDSFGAFKISAYSGNSNERPINDKFEDAISLTVGADYSEYVVVGTNLNASASEIFDSSIPTPICGLYAGGDVWYSAAVPSSGNLVVESKFLDSSALSDGAMSLYEGQPGALSLLECSDDTQFTLFPIIALGERTPGEIIYIRYYEYGNNAFGEFSISAYDQDLVDIDDHNEIEGFSFFPSPVDRVLNLKADSSIETVTVYNLLGEKVMDKKITETEYQLDLEFLQNGTYLIEVKVDDQIAVYKFMKI